jgi:hypothetical protein
VGSVWALECKLSYLYLIMHKKMPGLLLQNAYADTEQGPALALGIVALIEGIFIYRTSWEKAVEAAKARNAAN